MSDDESSNWRIPLIIAFGIILVILAALILTQIDNFQRRSVLPPKRLPIVDEEATVAAGDLGVIYLPSEVIITATATSSAANEPPIPTETLSSTAESRPVPSCDSIPGGWEEYVIVPGDSLSSLAVQFSISKNAIIRGNCLEHEQIIHGQMIYLPQNAPSLPSGENCDPPQGWIHYVVHPDDSLMNLAKKHETTVIIIMNANCLNNTILAVGQKLFLPPTPPEPPTRTFPNPTRRRPRATPTATLTIIIPTSTSTSASGSTTLPPATSSHTTTSMPSATHTQRPITQTSTPTALPSSTPTSTPTVTPSLTPTATLTPILPSPTATIEGYPPLDASPTATVDPYPS